MTAPIIAAKAGTDAAKALTGDIYTRRWTTKHGKTVVEHEARVNPVGIGLGAVAVGFTALAGAAALWVAQLRLVPATTKTGRKTVSIEQRAPFSVGDIVPNPGEALGLGKPIFGPWLKGQFWAKK